MGNQYEYLLLLLACLSLASVAGWYFGCLWGVVKETKRLTLVIGFTFLVFFVWDIWAITRGHWYFNERRVTGIAFLNVPIEEMVFFVVIPFLAVLTWETVVAAMSKIKF